MKAPDFGPWTVQPAALGYPERHSRSFQMIDAYRPQMYVTLDHARGGIFVSVEGKAPGCFAQVRGLPSWEVAHEVADAIARGYGWTLAEQPAKEPAPERRIDDGSLGGYLEGDDGPPDSGSCPQCRGDWPMPRGCELCRGTGKAAPPRALAPEVYEEPADEQCPVCGRTDVERSDKGYLPAHTAPDGDPCAWEPIRRRSIAHTF